MKFRINFNAGEPKPLTEMEKYFINNPIRGGVFLAVIIVLLYFILAELFFSRTGYYVYPGAIAAGDQVVRGISMFNGEDYTKRWGEFSSAMLLSVLLFYFIIPASFVFALARWRNSTAEEKALSGFRKTYLAAILTGALVFSIVAINITAFAVSRSVRADIIKGQRVSSARDYLTDEITNIDYSAREYLSLPAEAGGGNGSWCNFKLPEAKFDKINFGRWSEFLSEEDVRNVFLLKKGENDTTIIVTGIGNVRYSNGEFKNADGRMNFVQVTATLTPNTHTYKIDN